MSDAVDPVVLTLSVTLTDGVVLFRVSEAGNEQTGIAVFVGDTLQARVTVPLKPPVALRVMVDVADLPAVTVAEAGLDADSEKPPGCVVVTTKLTVAV